MSDRLLDAYYEYCLEQVRAGFIDHSLDAAMLDGKSVEEHIVEVLRAAGKLPRGWNREASHVELLAAANDRRRFVRMILPQPTGSRRETRHPEITEGWLRAG